MYSFRKLSLLPLLIVIAFFTSCNSGADKKASTAVNADSLYKKFNLDKIVLPAGFSISVFAQVPNARAMCWGDKGTLFVGNRGEDKVWALRDEDNDGYAERRFVIDTGLKMPAGVAFHKGSLYVSAISRILRYDDIENNLSKPPKAVVVYDKFPDKEHHGWKFIAFGPDDKLYVPVGAPCNVCEKKDSAIYASITRMDVDGSDPEIFAHGVRNTVGFAWHPVTKELWFTDNNRDMMGDDMPSCELNYAPSKGMHFGFPYCHQGDTPDSVFGIGKNCADYTPPAQKMGAHTAPLGMRFYTGDMFPSEYKNQIFIAVHGSWNRTIPVGYKIMMVTLDSTNKKVKDMSPFASGWLQNDKKVLGRPADVLVSPDGSLLVSDDLNGAIYKISYNK